jgi:hypothetical protein
MFNFIIHKETKNVMRYNNKIKEVCFPLSRFRYLQCTVIRVWNMIKNKPEEMIHKYSVLKTDAGFFLVQFLN